MGQLVYINQPYLCMDNVSFLSFSVMLQGTIIIIFSKKGSLFHTIQYCITYMIMTTKKLKSIIVCAYIMVIISNLGRVRNYQHQCVCLYCMVWICLVYQYRIFCNLEGKVKVFSAFSVNGCNNLSHKCNVCLLR